jgi:hypothetical protein
MTQTEIDALTSPKLGMVQYNTTEKKLQVYSKNTSIITNVFGNTTTTSSATCLTSGELWFRPSVSGNITTIELSASGSGETASLVIKSTNSCGTPTVLGTSNSITCIDGWNTWTFSTPVAVTANTVYYITSNDATACLGVRWSLSGDDSTTGSVFNMMGMGCSPSNNDPASRITVIQNVSNSNQWLNLFNTPTASSTLIDIANGGTGSSTQNFVDLSTDQEIAGGKKFNSDINVNGLTIGKGIGQVNEQNITIGENTLTNNTTGQHLIALGGSTLQSNTSANYNIGIGSSALSGNITGENNIAIGAAALAFNNGSNNTAIGLSASLLGNSLSNVTGLGYQAGMNNTGSSNTFLGANSDQNSANSSITNSTAIGFGAKINAANQIQLGNTNVSSVNTSGNLTANSFIKSGGSATEYLMADGSVSTASSTTIGAISSSSNSNGATINSGELSLAPADASNGGIVTTSAQSFAGNKTFTEGLKVENKPFLPTKLNQSQINSLTDLEEGMVVYNTDSRKLQVYSVGATDVINDLFSGSFTDRNLFDFEQSFVSPTTGVITAIQFFVKSFNGYPYLDFYVDFQNSTGSYIGGGGYFNPSNNTSVAQWVNVVVNNAVVSSGEALKFRIMAYAPELMFGTNSNYPNGALTAGCCGPANGGDVMFKILITPTNGSSAYWVNLN